MGSLGAVLGLAALFASGGEPLAEQVYALEAPAGQAARWRLEIPIPEGTARLEIEATWDAARSLAFKLEDAAGHLLARRSGLPPQSFAEPVPEDAGGPWTLRIRSLPAGKPLQGSLVIRWIRRARPAAEAAIAESPLPEEIPEATPPVLAATFARWRRPDGAERLDGCGWQAGFEEALVGWARAREEGARLEPKLRGFLERLARGVRVVQALAERTAETAAYAHEPPPGERERAVERELDRLLEETQQALPEPLAGADWPPRFASCLMACQRFFAARSRAGAERVAHEELATSQWEGFRLAADALETLLAAEPALDPPAP